MDDIEALFGRDQERENRAITGVIHAAGATPRWIYSKQFRAVPRLQLPAEFWIAADVGLGIGTLRFEGDLLIATVDWWPWRDVQEPELHAVTEVSPEGAIIDKLHFTIQRPRVDLDEEGTSGIALSNFAAAVLRSCD